MIDLRHFLGSDIRAGQKLKLGGVVGVRNGLLKVVEVTDKLLDLDGTIDVGILRWSYKGPIRCSLKILPAARRCAFTVILQGGTIEDPNATYEVRGRQIDVTVKLGDTPVRLVLLRNRTATDMYVHVPPGNPFPLKFWLVPEKVFEEPADDTTYDPMLVPSALGETGAGSGATA